MKTNFLNLSSKQLKCKSGVYAIYCNDKFYIGSSKSLYSRLLEHRQKLCNNYHSNDFMQKAFNKYGIENFSYEILEYCPEDVRIKREKHYIDTLKPDFNLQLDPVLKTLSVYSKQKLSKSILSGRKAGKYKTKYDYTPVEVYDYFGNYIKTYENKEIAAKELGLTKKIIQTLAGAYLKGRSRKGIRLRYANSTVPITKFDVDPKYLGKHFDFYSNGEYAFSSVKNVWEFFSKEILKGKTKFEIELKIKTE